MTEFVSLRRRLIEREFSRMNDMQRRAVFHTDGALLILAGAGSGKTTVLVNRIANMIRYGKAYASGEVPAAAEATLGCHISLPNCPAAESSMPA